MSEDIQIEENWFKSDQILVDMSKKLSFTGNLFSRPDLNKIDEQKLNSKVEISPQNLKLSKILKEKWRKRNLGEEEEFIDINFLQDGILNDIKINKKYSLSKDMRILNSTIIVPEVHQDSNKNKKF